MSYGGYNNQGGYGQANPYGEANPYEPQGGQAYSNQGVAQGGYGGATQGGYGGQMQQGGYGDEQQGRVNGGYGGNAVEMTPYNGQAGGYGQQTGRDPNAILNECRELDRGIESIQRNMERVRSLQQRSLEDTDASGDSRISRELDALSSETISMYRSFTARMKIIKQQRESGDPRNAPQVGKVDRKLKNAINQYQQMDSDFRKRLQEQTERQYRITKPEATEAEVQEACRDGGNQQIFSQALMNSDRRGQSQSVLRAVRGRHDAIQKLERDLIILAELFQDLEAAVIQQEPAVTQIEQKGEEVTENTAKANTEIDGAIVKARSRNRKKWWCLLICIIILIIIVVVVVVAVVVTNNNKPK